MPRPGRGEKTNASSGTIQVGATVDAAQRPWDEVAQRVKGVPSRPPQVARGQGIREGEGLGTASRGGWAADRPGRRSARTQYWCTAKTGQLGRTVLEPRRPPRSLRQAHVDAAQPLHSAARASSGSSCHPERVGGQGGPAALRLVGGLVRRVRRRRPRAMQGGAQLPRRETLRQLVAGVKPGQHEGRDDRARRRGRPGGGGAPCRPFSPPGRPSPAPPAGLPRPASPPTGAARAGVLVPMGRSSSPRRGGPTMSWAPAMTAWAGKCAPCRLKRTGDRRWSPGCSSGQPAAGAALGRC